MGFLSVLLQILIDLFLAALCWGPDLCSAWTMTGVIENNDPQQLRKNAVFPDSCTRRLRRL